MEQIRVVKIGGNIINDNTLLQDFLKDFAAIEGKKILVHGGGKLATELAAQLNVPQQMIEGRRITDDETLKIVTMVYAGYINKNIVAQLHAHHCDALGISGADGDIIEAHKRDSATDYGFVGDIDTVNLEKLVALLDAFGTIVIAPITTDDQGQLLNTNADTIAQEIAKALSHDYYTKLIYTFEKTGVLLDVNDEESVIHRLDKAYYKILKKEEKIFAGMIPKLDNAFQALKDGVAAVYIGEAKDLKGLLAGSCGTKIVL